MPAVATILLQEGRVLLIKRRDIPVWVLPGGGIDEGETPEEAAVREMQEETGFKVQIVRKIAEYTPINRLAGFTHYYECTPIEGSPKVTEETQKIAFFKVDNLPPLPPPYEDWIADALLNEKKVLKKKILSVTYKKFCKLLLTHPLLVGRFLLTKIGIHFNF